ncbi:MAG: hypothetical protein J5819_02735, partial [Eubacterium sp.]|nr:hypothetical protein [Eubacterium sp.]
FLSLGVTTRIHEKTKSYYHFFEKDQEFSEKLDLRDSSLAIAAAIWYNSIYHCMYDPLNAVWNLED